MQLLVVLSGVVMNWVLAFALFFIIAVNGHLTVVNNNNRDNLRGIEYYVTNTVKDSPIEKSGITVGNIINSIKIDDKEIEMKSPADISKILKENVNKDVTFNYTNQNGLTIDAIVTGVYGLNGNKKEKSFGIGFAEYGVEKLGFYDSIIYAKNNVIEYTKLTIIGVKNVFTQIATTGNISDSVTGPLGIYGLVSDSTEFGADEVLFLIAILSISLAVFNLLPVPALDGGRAVFILYEMITRKDINIRVFTYINAIGFVLLMLLMTTVIYKDIVRILW